MTEQGPDAVPHETAVPHEPDAAAGTPASEPVEERPHPLTPLVQVWVWVVASVLVVGRYLLENGGRVDALELQRMPPFLVFFVGASVLSLAVNAWRWWTTRFVAGPTELLIEHRGITHESKRIAYQRIQSVDLVQPFAARLLGMAQLTISAGADSATKLQYLSRARATSLRDELLARAHGTAASDAPVRTSALTDQGERDRVLLRVPPGELLIGAALSHELVLMIVVFGAPVALGIILSEPLLIGGGLLPMGLGVLGYLSKRIVSQFNYTLAATPAGLRITRGLTSLTSETMPTDRIQTLRIAEPVLWRLFGRSRVEVTLLKAMDPGEDDLGASLFLLPIGTASATETAVRAAWQSPELDAVTLQPAPRSARWLAPLAARFMAVGMDDAVAVVRRGWWTRTTTIIPHARLQSASVRQGPLARRLGLARVQLHSAGMGVTPDVLMTADDARAFVTAEVRRSRRARNPEAPGLA